MSRRLPALLLLAACGTRVEPVAPEAATTPAAEAAASEPGKPVGVMSYDGGPDLQGAPLPSGTVDVKVEDGPLGEQLVAQAKAARAEGLAPFVQLYGDWCPSCRKLRGAMGDPRMVEAFRGTRIVRLDTAAWGQELQRGLWIREGFSVPSFLVLNADGTFGAGIDGGAWGEDTVEHMSTTLQAFFRAHGTRAE